METQRRTAREKLDVIDAEIELIGFTRVERDEWEETRDSIMLSMLEKGFSKSLIAKASGYAISRVDAFLEKARGRRSAE